MERFDYLFLMRSSKLVKEFPKLNIMKARFKNITVSRESAHPDYSKYNTMKNLTRTANRVTSKQHIDEVK